MGYQHAAAGREAEIAAARSRMVVADVVLLASRGTRGASGSSAGGESGLVPESRGTTADHRGVHETRVRRREGDRKVSSTCTRARAVVTSPSRRSREDGVSTLTLRRRIAEGSVRAYRVGPRILRHDPVDVDQLMVPVQTG